MKQKAIQYLPGIMLLFILLIVGMLNIGNFGITWDEPQQRVIGNINYDYVFNGDNKLTGFIDKEYGAGFELLLTFIEKKLHFEDIKHIYLVRHAIVHLFFLLSAFAAYLLAYKLSRNQFIACFCFIMFVLSPRIYAHSFFNSKDIAFLSFCTITIAFSAHAFHKDQKIHYFLLGLLCGYTTSIRVMGIMLLCIFLFFIAIDLFQNFRNKRGFKHSSYCFLTLTIGFLITVYTCWPFLWLDPINNFVGAFRRMSHFSFGSVFFNGSNIGSESLPWSYFPVWFCMTTPILWLVMGLGGVMLILVNFFKKPVQFVQNTPERNYLLFALCFFLPVASVLILHSVIYDDWRHLYFVYPPFVFSAVYFVSSVYKRRFTLAIQSAIAIQVIGLVYFLVKNNPLGNIYFNSFVSNNEEYLRKHYEMDYWGSSYKKGLDYLVAKDKSDRIAFFTMAGIDVPLHNNLLLLSEKDRNRIRIVENPAVADYLITDFRGHPNDYPYKEVVYSIKVLNSTVLCIYKLR